MRILLRWGYDFKNSGRGAAAIFSAAFFGKKDDVDPLGERYDVEISAC